jgi:hypothetical protein
VDWLTPVFREEAAMRWIGLIFAFGILMSCSSGPARPEKGTPAFYWQAAKETFATGDNIKTLEHLDRLLAPDNEYANRALPWLLVVNGGMAAGYADLADQYETGARMNKADPSVFRRYVGDYRTMAKQLSLQFADRFTKFGQIKGDTISLAFGYPKGTATPSAQLTRVTNGIALGQADAELAQAHTLDRNVLLAACRAAGAPDDTAKGESILKDPEATVPRGTFAVAMAQTLFELSKLYGPTKADEPEKMRIFCERADDALKGVPETKQSKELAGKIQTALKKKKT